MASIEPSAAAKGFAIPELVEHILYCLANVAPGEEDDESPRKSMEPLITLAAVQRVDTMFHNTIKTSKKLQRLQQDVPNWDEKCSPALWLLGEKLGLETSTMVIRNSKYLSIEYVVQVLNLDFFDGAYQKKLKAFASICHAAPEASWRKLKLAKDIEMVSHVVFHKVGFREAEFIQFKSTDTLGALFERYCEIMGRSHEQLERERKNELFVSRLISQAFG